MNKLIGFLALVLLAAGAFLLFAPKEQATETYDPQIRPEEFSADVTNPYFTLVPGMQFVYEAKKPEGTEHVEVTVLNETKVVMGVTTRVVRDQVFLDGELIEDTWDWYAQDKEGNVWYVGEKTAEYENGEVTTTAGSWEGGVDGAKPGIIMMADPQVGDSYWEEYDKGEAEDRADVVALNENVEVPYGTFSGCVKTYNYTPLDPNSKENKYYCKDVGFSILEVDLEDNMREELVAVKRNVPAPVNTPPTSKASKPASPASGAKPPSGSPSASKNPPTPPAPQTAPSREITEAQARSIALARVPGTVTDVAIETKFGKKTYVVEIQATAGGETDVIIDFQTGAILAVE